MPKAVYKIYIHLLETLTRQTPSGLCVESTFTHGNQVLLSQRAFAESDGQFTLEFGPDLFANLSPNDSVSVDFEVFQDNRRLVSTGRIERLMQKDAKVEILVQPAPEEPVKEASKKSVQTSAVLELRLFTLGI